MEPEVLEIAPTPIKVQRKRRIVAAVLQAAFWTFWMFLWGYVRHRFGTQPDGPIALAVSCVFGGILFGLLIYFVRIPKIFQGKKGRPARVGIVVDCDQVAFSYQYSGSTSWIPKMVIHKGKVRSIFRIPGGIGVSERRQFGARMFGFFSIPNTLPKFEEVKGSEEHT